MKQQGQSKATAHFPLEHSKKIVDSTRSTNDVSTGFEGYLLSFLAKIKTATASTTPDTCIVLDALSCLITATTKTKNNLTATKKKKSLTTIVAKESAGALKVPYEMISTSFRSQGFAAIGCVVWILIIFCVMCCHGFSSQSMRSIGRVLTKGCCSSLALFAATSDDTDGGDDRLCAAVLVPGFLSGAEDFAPLCQTLTERGLPTVVVPMPNWHWIPCLGGRSARPILERIDFTVKHLIANNGDVTKPIPPFEYSFMDTWADFRTNPGGILKVGGASKVDDYPVVEPRGNFPLPENIPNKKVALIGHSAGGWISRVYLSKREYGGKVYDGTKYVHTLITLGTPHGEAPGPAFEGVSWVNEEEVPVRALSVAGTGFKGSDWGTMTQGSYAFCCPDGSDGSTYDGDGITPTFSSLAMPGSEQLLLEDVSHFCWSDVFGGNFVAPELTEDHKSGRPWYGSPEVVDEWSSFILDHIPQCQVR